MPAKRQKGTSSRNSGAGKRKRGIRGTVYANGSPYPELVKREGVSLLMVLSAIIGIGIAILLWWCASWLFNYIEKETRYDRIIVQSAVRNGIDPCLLKAVIWKESRFNANARGTKGEIGLMQVMPQTCVKDWATNFGRPVPSNAVLSDPSLNIEIGSWYLGQCIKHWRDYDDCTILALCEYNAGIQRATKWKPLLPDQSMINSIDIASTRRYVDEITVKKKEYAQKWNWSKYK